MSGQDRARSVVDECGTDYLSIPVSFYDQKNCGTQIWNVRLFVMLVNLTVCSLEQDIF